MNSTPFITSVTFNNISITRVVEPWFIPLDIFSIICTIFAVGLATLFLLVIIFDKRCHTVPMMLIANTCLAELICGVDIFAMTVFALVNDLKKTQYQDSLCVFRGYLSISSSAIQYYSFVIEATYRYTIVIYPNNLVRKSLRTQILLIGATWMFGFVFPLPFIFTGDYTYDVENQLCQIPLPLSITIIFTAFCVYLIPMNMIIFIYLKLIRYVKETSKRVTPVNTLARAQRELKMVHRIVMLVSILSAPGLPQLVFILMSFFTSPPKYDLRIVLAFIDVALVSVMVALFQFTDTLKTSVKKFLQGRPNTVVPALA
jgi:hypothetical protein